MDVRSTHEVGVMPLPHHLVAFVHLEKAAGTTVAGALRAAHPFRYAYVRPIVGRGPVFATADLAWYRRLNPAISIVAGHAVKPHSDLADHVERVDYLTILRRPADRYVSHALHRIEDGEFDSPTAFAADPRFHDLQVRSLVSTLHETRPMARSDVGSALSALDDFAAVGVVERLGRFAADVGSSTGIKLPTLETQRRNAAAARRVRSRWTPELVASALGSATAEANQMDQLLYDAVLERVGAEVVDPDEVQRILAPGLRSMIGTAAQRLAYDPLSSRARRKTREQGDGWY